VVTLWNKSSAEEGKKRARAHTERAKRRKVLVNNVLVIMMMAMVAKYARRERDPTTSPEMRLFISSRGPRISLTRIKIPRINEDKDISRA